jgi:hypothetical protein
VSSIRNRYTQIIEDDREAFGQGPVVYDNDLIVVLDCVDLCPPMPKPWDKRPNGEDDIWGLCLHQSAVWSSFEQQNRTAKTRRPGAQERLTYTLGVHHQPDKSAGKIVVNKFNEYDEVSWHSGGKAKWRTDHYVSLCTRYPHRSINERVVALCLRGLLVTPWHHENWPEKSPKSKATRKSKQDGDLILRASKDQIRAAYGVHLMCQELFGNYRGHRGGEESWLLGHKDTGKVACPGDDAYGFVQDVRAGKIGSVGELEAWIEARGLPDGGYPESKAFPSPRQFQWILVALGFDLGLWGSQKDGVDGQWGQTSARTLAEFEANEGLLTNGDPDMVSFERLENRFKEHFGQTPPYQSQAWPNAIAFREKILVRYTLDSAE